MQIFFGRKPLGSLGNCILSLLCLLHFAAAGGNIAQAQTDALSIELNKVEDLEGNCVASIVVANRLGQRLDRFSLDLFVFDAKGVISRQLLLDLAPLRRDKTSVARFALIDSLCAEVTKVLVNDIPACRSEDGQDLDCLKNLAVYSRSTIQLTK
jgi:hypothetical protein